MKITKILKLLEKKYKASYEFHLFSDYSGHIEDSVGATAAQWDSKKEMKTKLTTLFNDLSKNKQGKLKL